MVQPSQVLGDIDGDGDFLDGMFQWSSHSDAQRRRAEDHSKTRGEGEGEGQVGGGGGGDGEKRGAEATEEVTKVEEAAPVVTDEALPTGLE